jgi:lipopolysaccharide export system permease protein
MKIIDRYLSTTIAQTTLLVLLMLMGLSVFITLVKELGDVGTGDYRLLAALEFVLLDLPKQLYLFFPVAALLGVLLGLGLLASHNELTVLRGSGLSIGRIAGGVLKIALVLLVIATLFGEGLAPMAEHKAESQKALLISRGQAFKTTQGTWMRDGQNFLYIRAILGAHRLEGISRYQIDDQHNLTKADYAQSGVYMHHHWVMQNIVESQISLQKVETQKIAQADWQLTIDPELLRISIADPAEMSLWQLHAYLNYLRSNNLDASSYALAFWQRIMQPLATLVMIWLAIPFVFGPLRKATMGLRILLGATIGFAFITLSQFFGPISIVYQLSPLLAALLPIMVFALVAYALQRRVR